MHSKNIIILIPPSEGKQSGGTHRPLGQASADVQPILNQLQSFKGDWEKLLGVKGKALEEAVQANRHILTSPTLPAIERYAGVVYDGIDYPSLKPAAKKFFDEHVRIISAVFGWVKPQDLIPAYKLKIEKLNADKYWRPIIRKELTDCFIIDLLPQAHQKAVEYQNGIRLDFILEKDGKRTPAGHDGKLIKGRFIRWICENQITAPSSFKNFIEQDFRWDGKNFIKTT